MQRDATIPDPTPSGALGAVLTDIPLTLLRAELERRSDGGSLVGRMGHGAGSSASEDGEQPKCGSERPVGSYNVALHVGALFLILFLSTFGVFIPMTEMVGWMWLTGGYYSVLVPDSCSEVSWASYTPTIPFPFATFWNGCADSYGFCAPFTHCVYISYGPVSAELLE